MEIVQVRAGYNCISLSSSIQFSSYFQRAILFKEYDKIIKTVNHNVCALGDIIEYNLSKGVKMFRMSSGLVPFCNSPELIQILIQNEVFTSTKMSNELKRIKTLVKENNVRLTIHPGQYVVLNSDKPDVVERSVRELSFHSLFLDLVGGDTIVIHLGSKNNGKDYRKKLFIERAKNHLSRKVLSKLIIENDDTSYNTEDIIDVVKELGIRWVYDIHHEMLNPSKDVMYNLRNYPPTKFHVCDGLNGLFTRTHDYWVSVSTINKLINQIATAGIHKADIMFESKNKDLALFDTMRHIGNGLWVPREINKRLE